MPDARRREHALDQLDTDGDDAGTSATSTTGDGLLDGVETDTGVFVGPGDTGTDPLLADTDEDDYGDGAEVQAGTDPTDPLSFPDAPAVPALPLSGLVALAAALAASSRRMWPR